MCMKSSHLLPGIGCIKISDEEANVANGDAVCLYSSSMFAPKNLEEFEKFRLAMLTLKSKVSLHIENYIKF